MKKTILFVILIQLAAVSFGQQPNPAKTLSREAFLKKRSHQNTAAHLLLWGGLTAIIAGAAIDQTLNYNGPRWFGFPSRGTNKYQHGGAFIAYSGLVSVLGSIPFFFSAAKNRNKAMQLALKNESMPEMAKQGFVHQPVPSLNLKTRL